MSAEGRTAPARFAGADMRAEEARREEKVGEGWMALGETLRRIRESRGWSLLDMAEVCNLHPETISSVEHAHHEPRGVTLDRIARALGPLPSAADAAAWPVVLSEESEETTSEDGERCVQRVIVIETLVPCRPSGEGA